MVESEDGDLCDGGCSGTGGSDTTTTISQTGPKWPCDDASQYFEAVYNNECRSLLYNTDSYESVEAWMTAICP